MSEDVCHLIQLYNQQKIAILINMRHETEGMDCYECDANSGIDRAGDRNL